MAAYVAQLLWQPPSTHAALTSQPKRYNHTCNLLSHLELFCCELHLCHHLHGVVYAALQLICCSGGGCGQVHCVCSVRVQRWALLRRLIHRGGQQEERLSSKQVAVQLSQQDLSLQAAHALRRLGSGVRQGGAAGRRDTNAAGIWWWVGVRGGSATVIEVIHCRRVGSSVDGGVTHLAEGAAASRGCRRAALGRGTVATRCTSSMPCPGAVTGLLMEAHTIMGLLHLPSAAARPGVRLCRGCGRHVARARGKAWQVRCIAGAWPSNSHLTPMG